MATYFHHGNSEIQGADGLHTLYLMNPNYAPTTVPYSEHHQQQQQSVAPTMLINPVATAYNPTHHFFVGSNASEVAGSRQSLQEISTTFHGIPHSHNPFHYNTWDQITNSHQQQLQQRQQQHELQQQQQQQQQQGNLCLSLSSQHNTGGGGGGGGGEATNYHEVPTVAISPSSTNGDDHQVRTAAFLGNSYSSVSAISNNGNHNNIVGVRSVLLGSKYLKAARELLDEVVNVGKGILKASTANNLSNDQGNKEKMKMEAAETVVTPVGTVGIGGSSSTTGGESNSTCNKHGFELTTAQRQDLQMKKSKLLSMLDEVEQRYRQYHEQMQIVISTFEQVVGFGSAKTYTALALQTISKQFRCLKDAISAQIKATNKSIGEEDCINDIGVKIEGSRLKYVDHQLRQQRAMQQLGVIQNNAWRPQRGLPERAVSVLRAWLFEHFLHPYPKDSDKVMLAKQTGLTRSQVSNWFINARVRLWKPMVEEMYKEEMKEQRSQGQEQNGNLEDHNKTNKIIDQAADKESQVTTVLTNPQDHQSMMRSFHQIKTSQSNPEKFSPTHDISLSPNMGGGSLQTQLPCFNLIGSSSSDMAITSSEIPKRPKTSYLHNSPTSTSRDYQAGALIGAYPIGDQTNQFAPSNFHGNAVSLTLGLPHCDNNKQLSHFGTQQNYLSNHNIPIVGNQESSIDEFCAMRPQPTSHSSAGAYETLDNQNRSSKRFAAQLLPDFVS